MNEGRHRAAFSAWRQFIRRLAARLHLSDAGVPVGERGTCSTAASERCRGVLRQSAGLSDVLRRKPDVVSVDHSGAIVAPSWTGGVRSVVERVTAEAVSRAKAGRGHLYRAAFASINASGVGAEAALG